MKNYIITGTIGSGKTTAISFFKKDERFNVIECDAITHELYEPDGIGTNLIKDSFGPEFITEYGVDRKKLGKLVFDDSYLLKKLGEVIHPVIVEMVKTQLSLDLINIIDVPLYFETHLDWGFRHKVVLIHAKRTHSKERLMKREDLTEEQAMRLIDIQIDIDQKVKMSNHVIYNDSDISFLKNEVEKFIEEIT